MFGFSMQPLKLEQNLRLHSVLKEVKIETFNPKNIISYSIYPTKNIVLDTVKKIKKNEIKNGL